MSPEAPLMATRAFGEEPRRSQRRDRPTRCSSWRALVREVEGCGEFDEFVVGEGGFDEPEEDAFLVAYVGLEAGADLVEVFRSWHRVGGQVGRAAAKVDVLDEYPHDGVVRWGVVTGKGGQEDVFLDAKVRAAFLVPEGEEGPARCGGSRVSGALEPLGNDEAVVVVAGELGEGVAAFHPWAVRADRGEMTLMLVCLIVL